VSRDVPPRPEPATLARLHGLANLVLAFPIISEKEKFGKKIVTTLRSQGVSDQQAQSISGLGDDWQKQLEAVFTSQQFQTMRNRVEFVRKLQSGGGMTTDLEETIANVASYFRNMPQKKKQAYEVEVQDRDLYEFVIMMERFLDELPGLGSVNDWKTFVTTKSTSGRLAGQEWFLHNTDQLVNKIQTLIEQMTTSDGRSKLINVAEELDKESPIRRFAGVKRFIEGYQGQPQSESEGDESL